MHPLHVALAAMLAQQTCATIGRTTVPVIAPVVLGELGLSPALVGVFVSLAACAGIATTLGCGSFILRHGAVRMTQVGMLALAAGLAASAAGLVPVFVAAALAIGVGSAVATPASSHLLSRFATPAQAPLVFSIKQTGVPVGLMLAGVLAPFLVATLGWREALIIMGALCGAVALALQPLRAGFDQDRRPDQSFSVGDIRDTLLMVLRTPDLRLLAFTSYSFVGLQSVFSAYLVLFLVNAQGYDLMKAGSVFSVAMAVAIPARILWGWIAGRFVSPRRMLACLGLTMALAALLVSLIGPDWPVAAVIAAVMLTSASALSWHGVLLAEVARLAAPGRVGATTGGVLAFGDAAALTLPLVFGALLATTGAYGVGFGIVGLPSLLVGLFLLLGRAGQRPAPAIDSGTSRPRNS